jgi:hypothetical protein
VFLSFLYVPAFAADPDKEKRPTLIIGYTIEGKHEDESGLYTIDSLLESWNLADEVRQCVDRLGRTA